MFFSVFKHVEGPARDAEFLHINRLLIFLIHLFGAGELIEVVVAAEVLVIEPDVLECKS